MPNSEPISVEIAGQNIVARKYKIFGEQNRGLLFFSDDGHGTVLVGFLELEHDKLSGSAVEIPPEALEHRNEGTAESVAFIKNFGALNFRSNREVHFRQAERILEHSDNACLVGFTARLMLKLEFKMKRPWYF